MRHCWRCPKTVSRSCVCRIEKERSCPANALRRELVLLVSIFFSTPEQMQHSESHYSQPAPGTSSTTTSPTGKAVLLLLQSDRNPSHAHTHGRHWTVRDDPDPDQEALTVAQSRGAVSEDTNDSSKKKSETTTTPRLSESPRARRKHPPASSPRLGSPRRSSPPPPCS